MGNKLVGLPEAVYLRLKEMSRRTGIPMSVILARLLEGSDIKVEGFQSKESEVLQRSKSENGKNSKGLLNLIRRKQIKRDEGPLGDAREG